MRETEPSSPVAPVRERGSQRLRRGRLVRRTVLSAGGPATCRSSQRGSLGSSRHRLPACLLKMVGERSFLDALDDVNENVIAPAAREVDETARFPRASIDALAEAGLLGLVSAREVGGLGGGLPDAVVAGAQSGGPARVFGAGVFVDHA